MALIKVKNSWTQVPNTWLKDNSLSLKAKGLLAVMQSLPDDWNYSISGLAQIMKEGADAIRSTIHELECSGYLTRTQIRDDKGQIIDFVYTLYENPKKPSSENPLMDDPRQYNKDNNRTNKKEKADAENSANASFSTSSRSPFSSVVNNQDGNSAGTAIDLKADNKKHYALCSELLKLMGQDTVKPGVKLKSAVVARLNQGYSEDDLKRVAKWARYQTDDFYKVPHSLFSEAGYSSALVKMDSEKPRMTTTRTI